MDKVGAWPKWLQRDNKQPSRHGLGSLLQRSDRVKAGHRLWDGQWSHKVLREGSLKGRDRRQLCTWSQTAPPGNSLTWAGDLISRSCPGQVYLRVTGAAC